MVTPLYLMYGSRINDVSATDLNLSAEVIRSLNCTVTSPAGSDTFIFQTPLIACSASITWLMQPQQVIPDTFKSSVCMMMFLCIRLNTLASISF